MRHLPTLIALCSLVSFCTGAVLSAEDPRDCSPLIKDYVRTSKDLSHSEDAPWKLVCAML